MNNYIQLREYSITTPLLIYISDLDRDCVFKIDEVVVQPGCFRVCIQLVNRRLHKAIDRLVVLYVGPVGVIEHSLEE